MSDESRSRSSSTTSSSRVPVADESQGEPTITQQNPTECDNEYSNSTSSISNSISANEIAPIVQLVQSNALINENPIEGTIQPDADWWQNLGGPLGSAQSIDPQPEQPEEPSETSESTKKSHSSHRSKKKDSDIESSDDIEFIPFPSVSVDPFQINELKIQRSYNGPQFVRYDKAAPLLWTVGYLIIAFVDLFAMLFHYQGIASFKENPWAGTDYTTVLAYGAKYGPLLELGEWWRFLTPIIEQAGIIQYIIFVIILITMKDFEKHNGFWHSLITFLVGGAYGYILSAMLVPDFICCGASSAIMCWIGIRATELYFIWQTKAKFARLICLILSFITLVLTALFFPFSDNIANAGGIVMGVLIALMMLPNVKMQSWQAVIRGLIALLAFPVMATLFCICLVLYYRGFDTNSCKWCNNIACIQTAMKQWCATPVYA